MNASGGRLIAFEGANGAALDSRARAFAADRRDERSCLSVWDASGIFKEVQLATVGAGDPSARTLLLLYAADLAYRLRAEITPALDAGRLVIVAPYIDTAVAFAHGIGLDPEWVAGILSFAPPPHSRQLVKEPPARKPSQRKGFVELSCRQLLADGDDEARAVVIRRTELCLAKLAAS